MRSIRRLRSLIRAVIVAAVATFFAAFAPSVQAHDAPASFSNLVKEMLPAVVNIATTQEIEGAMPIVPPGADRPQIEEFFRDFYGDETLEGARRQVSALGSGFIIDPGGYIVTTNHVVAESEETQVILADERRFDATVVGTDPATDLALLKVEAGEPLPVLRWGASETAEVGDWVVAIGNPFGLGGTVTAGVLSGRARDIRIGPYDDFLQTDTAVNSGNSGGPLFDLSGGVIGVNTVILSPDGGNIGISFAIPASTAKPIVKQLREHGKVRRGWLGVHIQSVTDKIADAVGLGTPRGALVADVVPDGPAAAAGLKAGDVVLSFDGQSVVRSRDLPRIVANTPIGQTVAMDVWRDGREIAVEATVAERNPARAIRMSDRRSDVPLNDPPGAETLGMRVAPLDDPAQNRFDSEKTQMSGVVVTGVRLGGPAAENGLRAGDVIVAINQDEVSSPQQFVDQVDAAKRQGRRTALLRIIRGDTFLFIAVPV